MDDKRFSRLEAKVDDANDQLAAINIRLAELTILVKEHERRSLTNEKGLEFVMRQVFMVQGALALIAVVTGILKATGKI